MSTGEQGTQERGIAQEMERIEEKYKEMENKTPMRQGTFLGEEKEGEGESDVSFVVALSDEEIYKLSPLAYYVWLLCDGQHKVSEIGERMSKELQISVEETHEPLVLALETLASVNLVKFVE